MSWDDDTKKTIMRKKLTLKMGDASGAQNEKGSDVKNGCKKKPINSRAHKVEKGKEKLKRQG